MKEASRLPLTCEVRYTLDLNKLKEFEAYARAWMILTERHGGTHHGYYIPRPPSRGCPSQLSQAGHEGPTVVAIALFSFPDDESYLRYRETVANNPDCGPAASLYRETGCFISYERLFLSPVERSA